MAKMQSRTRKEDGVHVAVCQYLTLQYPSLLWHHSPNEGKRNGYQQMMVKKMGVKSGFPDLIIFAPIALDVVKDSKLALRLLAMDSSPVLSTEEPMLGHLFRCGLAIELKREDEPGQAKAVASENQVLWIRRLKENLFTARVCKGTMSALKTIDDYMEIQKLSKK